jgi:pantoate--beta-alanine ligase
LHQSQGGFGHSRGHPRDTGRDAALAEKVGVDVLFCPEVEEIYPEGYSTYVEVTGLQDGLCGAFRPGHFRGVATVCLKLFNIVKPDVAVFGQKDAQQSIIIRRMIEDLNLAIEMVTVPTVREPDGLAISSRNGYLSEEERRQATVLHEALEYAKRLVQSGERDSEKIISEMTQLIERKPLARIEYVAAVDARDLKTVDSLRGDVLIAVACRFGNARLIDNLNLKIPADDRF